MGLWIMSGCGSEDTSIYGLYGYMHSQRVGCSVILVINRVSIFGHFWHKYGMVLALYS